MRNVCVVHAARVGVPLTLLLFIGGIDLLSCMCAGLHVFFLSVGLSFLSCRMYFVIC